MNYNYHVKTISYGKEIASYYPIFDNDPMELLRAFCGGEATTFPDHVMQEIKQAIDEPNKLHDFTGNIYYMEIVNGEATFGNDLDENDDRPLVHVEIHELLHLMEQWLSDVKFLRRQMEQLPKKRALITTYLKEKYGYTDQRAAEAIQYLNQQQEIAVEFVYYIEHGDFIPEKYASIYSGYTAKRLKQEISLSELGAFNYMVYLKRKPEEALANLKKGLPRRKLFSPQDVENLKKYMD